MASRHGAYISVQVPVYGGVSPNAYVQKITVEVRAFWPPYLGYEDQVIDLIDKAAKEAIRKVILERNAANVKPVSPSTDELITLLELDGPKAGE